MTCAGRRLQAAVLQRVIGDVGERDVIDRRSALVENFDPLILEGEAEMKIRAQDLACAPHRLVPGRLRVRKNHARLVDETVALTVEVEVVTGHAGRTRGLPNRAKH